MTFFSLLKTCDKFVYLHQIPSMIYSNKEHWSICSNTYFMDTVGFAFTTTACAFQTRRAKRSHCEEFDNKRHIRWIQSTWREKRTCNHFRSVQINIFFIFVCIHVSTMRCENCTVRPSVHKMKRCFPGGISSVRWHGINMDAQLLLQTGRAIVAVRTPFKCTPVSKHFTCKKQTDVQPGTRCFLSVTANRFGGLVNFYCDFCRMSESLGF